MSWHMSRTQLVGSLYQRVPGSTPPTGRTFFVIEKLFARSTKPDKNLHAAVIFDSEHDGVLGFSLRCHFYAPIDAHGFD